MEKAGRASTSVFWVVAAVFLAGLVLRWQYVTHFDSQHALMADTIGYSLYAKNIAVHGVFSEALENPSPDSFCSPGFPFFLSLIIRVAGEENFFPWAVTAQVLLSALMVLLVYRWALFFMGRGWAVGTAALMAFCPHFVTFGRVLLTETLFSFLLLCACLLFQFAIQNGKALTYAAAGLVFGCAYLTNETALFLPFILSGGLIVLRLYAGEKGQWGKIVRNLMVFILLFCLFPAAWSVRNSVNVADDVRKNSERAIGSVANGSYPGWIYKNPAYKYYPFREDPMQPEYGESVDSFRRIFWQRFQERPFRYISWYLFEKPYYFWRWAMIRGTDQIFPYPNELNLYQQSTSVRISRTVMALLHPFLLLLALLSFPFFIALVVKKRRTINNTPWSALAVVCYATLLYMIFQPLPRYSIPYRPQLYIAAVWALSFFMGRRGLERGDQAKTTSAAIKYAAPVIAVLLFIFCTALALSDNAAPAEKRLFATKVSLLEARTGLTITYAKRELAQGHTQEAISLLNDFIRLRPDHAGGRCLLGQALLLNGQTQEAMEELQAAIALDKDRADAYNALGLALKQRGRLIESLEATRRALALDPGMVEAQKNLASLELTTDRIMEALRSTGEGNANAQFQLGALLMARNMPAQAAAYFENALALSPGSQPVMNQLGLAFMESGDLEKAGEQFQRILETDHNNITALYNMACLQAVQGDAEGAVEWLRRCADLGFQDWNMVGNDEQLSNVRDVDVFRNFLKGIKHS